MPILQLAAIAVGSFGVLALLVSYLRYRSMQLCALDQVGQGGMTIPSAVLVLLTELRKSGAASLQLLAFRVPGEGSGSRLYAELKNQVRKEDRVLELEQGEVVALLRCPAENREPAARRICLWLQENGCPDGMLRLYTPVADAHALEEWLRQEPRSASGEGWGIDPVSCTEAVLGPHLKPVEVPPVPDSPAVDPLTGVPGAKWITQSVRHQLAGHRRAGREVSLVRVQVDELSRYSSGYGKNTVDKILRKTAVYLMENCRETDLIGYLGEGEFLMAMPGRREDLLNAVNRMCGMVKNGVVEEEGNEIRFSASFGVASMPRDGKNPAELLDRAGLAMEEASARGRGMCLAFQSSMIPEKTSGAGTGEMPESF